ncbi:MAG: class I SAM-dependent RNA methyltransferase [Desulfobulbaceae bacterium]|nr:class I SAM-dependent RNA methyltransferase [Desulfobulbaceae bacterium]
MQTEKVLIDKVVTGGLGLGRMADGMVFMIPYVLPGEEVLIRPGRRKKNYLEADLVEVVSASPRRIEANCPHFGVCGGCDFQHVEYGYQLELKSGVLRENLAAAKIMEGSDLGKVMEEPLEAARPFGYRQRLRLQVDNNGGYGFFRRSSHEVEVIESCPLAMPSINKVMESFASSEAMGHLLDTAREVELLASPGDESVVLIVRLRRKPRPADLKAADRASDQLKTVKAVYLAADSVRTQGPYCGSGSDDDEDRSLLLLLPFPAIPHHRIPAYTLSQEAGGFCQVNPEQNRKMIATMLDWVDTLKAERALDLFGGMGNFSIPLAMKFKEVVGLDRQRAAIRGAEQNAEKAGLKSCSFIRKSAEEGIKEFGAAGEIFDLVLLDPPRRGCREVLPFLSEIGNPAVIYISCDPATLARDLKDMSENGYTVRKVKMVDMFPQTHHLESMVLLTR